MISRKRDNIIEALKIIRLHCKAGMCADCCFCYNTKTVIGHECMFASAPSTWKIKRIAKEVEQW